MGIYKFLCIKLALFREKINTSKFDKKYVTMLNKA